MPYDPSWPYTPAVADILKNVRWRGNYELTIAETPVYRRFPPKSDPRDPETLLLKPPEKVIIADERGEAVAVAWVCETARRGQKKAIEIGDRPWVRNLAVRVKNFTIGRPGLYSDQDVTDVANLDWFVGEIYVTDPDIRPDTKRTQFQPSLRHDEVVRALRRFYSSTALRARAWSRQVVIEDKCAEIETHAENVRALLAQMSADPSTDLTHKIEGEVSAIDKALTDVDSARKEAVRTDSKQEAESSVIVRSYLRKPEVMEAVQAAIGTAAATKRLVGEAVPGAKLQLEPSAAPNLQRRPSRARSARLKGETISTGVAVGSRVLVGTLPGLDVRLDNTDGRGNGLVSIETAVACFRAAVVSVLGEDSESTQRILDRVAVELRRRGVDV